MGISNETKQRAPKRKGLRFIAGVALMAVSFLVYPAYSIIILLPPFSGKIKAVVIVLASLLSWAIFSIGIFLAGKEGYDWLKRVGKP